MKNGDAEGSPEAQRIQQGKMVFHGSASNPGNDPVADIGSLRRALRGRSHLLRPPFKCVDRRMDWRALCRPGRVIAVTTTLAHPCAVVTAADHAAGIGARPSAFPVVKPHTAMRGAFALCDSPHAVNERCPYTKTTLHEPTWRRLSQTGLWP